MAVSMFDMYSCSRPPGGGRDAVCPEMGRGSQCVWEVDRGLAPGRLFMATPVRLRPAKAMRPGHPGQTFRGEADRVNFSLWNCPCGEPVCLPIIGSPRKLRSAMLPSGAQVLGEGLWVTTVQTWPSRSQHTTQRARRPPAILPPRRRQAGCSGAETGKVSVAVVPEGTEGVGRGPLSASLP